MLSKFASVTLLALVCIFWISIEQNQVVNAQTALTPQEVSDNVLTQATSLTPQSWDGRNDVLVKIGYKDRDGIIRFDAFLVDILDSQGQLLTRTSSSESGEVRVRGITNSSFTVRVWMQDPEEKLELRPANLNRLYIFDFQNITANTQQNIIINHTLGYIWGDIRKAQRNNWPLPPLTIFWEKGINFSNCPQGAFYCNKAQKRLNLPGRGLIFLDSNDTDPIIVYHELGHAIMDAVAPKSPGKCGGPHKMLDISNECLAWSEGWADFVGVLLSGKTLLRFGASIEAPFLFSNFRKGVYPKPEDAWKSELLVAAALWDLYDKGFLEDENITIPLSDMLRALKLQPQNFKQYTEGLASLGYRKEVGKILEHNGFSSLATTPPKDQAPRTVSISIPSQVYGSIDWEVFFEDPDGDVNFIKFEQFVTNGWGESGSWNPNVYGQKSGSISVTTKCNSIGQFRKRVTLYDAAGNQSTPYEYTLNCVQIASSSGWLVENTFDNKSGYNDSIAIHDIEIMVYNLAGLIVLRENGQQTFNQQILKRNLANGIYLAVITVRDLDGYPIRREVKKIVVLR